MLTLIKLIHNLNRQIDWASNRLKPNRASHAQIRFQAICAVIALSLGGLGSIEAAQAKSLDVAGIRQSLQISTNNLPKLGQSASVKLKQDSASMPLSQKISQNTSPPPPAPTRQGRLDNNLNLPRTGAEIQITKNRALTLREATEIAFQNNRDVQAARLTVDRSKTGISEAEAAKAVQVGLTSTLQNQGTSVIFGERSQSTSGSSIQGRLEATYNILNAGRDTSRLQAAEEQVKFDRLDLLRIEQKVRADVITAYYSLQEADSSSIINQAAVKDATRSLSDAQLQEKAGVGTKFDILRAQVQLATANQDLTRSQGQQQTARKKIAQLLSVDENTEFKAADTVRELGDWNYNLENSVVLAYKNRPEVQQQLTLRNISKQQQIVASAADSAQVNLFANYTLGKTINAATAAQDDYRLGAQLSWSFWDGGAAGARSTRETFTQEISENQFTNARNQIRFEVEQAYYSLGTNKKNIATATESLKQAEESLKLARLRFQAGVGTQTDVIQAQTELARARGNRIAAIINYNRALSSLRIATVLPE